MILHLFAQINATTMPNYFPPARINNFATILGIIIPLVFITSALVLLGVLIAASIRIITAGGNPESLKSGRNMFKYALLGFVIIALSYIITKLIGFVTNVAIPI
jgi:hypothetical protein